MHNDVKCKRGLASIINLVLKCEGKNADLFDENSNMGNCTQLQIVMLIGCHHMTA